MSDRDHYCMTPPYKSLVLSAQEQEVGAIKAQTDEIIEHLIQNEHLPARDIAAAIAVHADRWLAESIQRKPPEQRISCTVGCAACCKQIVMVSRPEGERLAELAQEIGLVLDRERLRRQAACDEDTWLELAEADRACPFLGEDQRCRIYAERPLSCRKYFVLSDPIVCDTEKTPGGRPLVWFDHDCEILATAAFTAYPSGSIAQALFDRWPEEKGGAPA